MPSRTFEIVVEAVYPGMSSIIISVNGRRHLMPSALLPATQEWFNEMTGRPLVFSISAEEQRSTTERTIEGAGSSSSNEVTVSAT